MLYLSFLFFFTIDFQIIFNCVRQAAIFIFRKFLGSFYDLPANVNFSFVFINYNFND